MPLGTTPALGYFLSPTQGFWKNIEVNDNVAHTLVIKGKSGKAITIVYDERGVPHIFAEDEADMFYAQGYVTAKDRLWQMDFISRFAAGRLSEVMGDRTLEVDRYNRRIGIPYAAKTGIEYAIKDDLVKVILESYSSGVNAYIQDLSPSEYPFEFKLLGYKPEAWSPYKCGLMMKYMAYVLTGGDLDIEFTNALNLFGRENFNLMYPDFPALQDPIVPIGTKFTTKSSLSTHDSSTITAQLLPHPHLGDDFIKGLGSNNWAVTGDKSYSGKPILCNDPHLSLKLPLIWYEVQLSCPTYNSYGVSMPGGPCVLIGYNDSISHGATNGSMDVRDWYSLDINNKKQYATKNGFVNFEIHKEIIKVRGKTDFIDNVKWTTIGPVVYDATFGDAKDKEQMTLAWTSYIPSADIKTFYFLNKAKNHADYEHALSYFSCPSQNFIFADDENIAIHEQGNLWWRQPEQGKFVRPLSSINIDSVYTNFIPKDLTPHILNPPRNFVSSANQHPTDKTYPFYYVGNYENYRNRRINEVLNASSKMTIEELKRLQYDEKSVLASEILPYMLSQVNGNNLDDESAPIYNLLSKWNFFTTHNQKEPAYFYLWWRNLENLAWDEMNNSKVALAMPENYTTVELLKNNNAFPLFDVQKTKAIETGTDVINKSFQEMVTFFSNHKDSLPFDRYKNTTMMHLARIAPLSLQYLPVGGYQNVVNATSQEWGASWRMIVDFKNGRPQGYGVYPGGQSGNPASNRYTSFVNNWITGEFYTHNFYQNKEQALKSLKK
jgi:penicillin amidase